MPAISASAAHDTQTHPARKTWPSRGKSRSMPSQRSSPPWHPGPVTRDIGAMARDRHQYLTQGAGLCDPGP
ncbi:UNVERIFIED_ORG: hypothetical protein M2348_001746 [Sphingomonas sp. R1F5B]